MSLQIIALLIFMIAVISISKIVFRSFFSPIVLYFTIWITLFSLYLARFVLYDPVKPATWLIIMLSLFSFWLGSMTIALIHMGAGQKRGIVAQNNDFAYHARKISRSLLRTVLLLSFIALLAVVGEWFLLLKRFEGFHMLFTRAGEIRALFARNELDFGIFEYLIVFAYAGAVLGGVYLAIISSRSIIVFLPMLAIVLFAVPITARLNILWGALLYFNAYVLARLACGKAATPVTWKGLVTIFSLGIALFLVFNCLWQARIGAGEYPLFERYASSEAIELKQVLINIMGNSRIGRLFWKSLISNYVYATNTFAKLNAVLNSQVAGSGASLTWGTYSFAAAARLLAKMGIRIEGDLSGQVNQLMTPVPAKPGTYLNQAVYDFGWLGAVLLPYLLGSLSSWFYFKCLVKPTFTSLGVLSVLYLAIEYSWHNSLFIHTAPFGTLLLLLIIAYVLDKRIGRLRASVAKLISVKAATGEA